MVHDMGMMRAFAHLNSISIRCFAPNGQTKCQEAGLSGMPEYLIVGTTTGICDRPF
jgi:hypothetical protein